LMNLTCLKRQLTSAGFAQSDTIYKTPQRAR
jgi:hypothetical protein